MPGGCTRITLKKYASRPSPPYHARACRGQTKKGNDGKLYKSIADKSGVYTWRSLATIKKRREMPRYETHDNYSRPFAVEIDEEKHTADVWRTGNSAHVGLYHYKQIWLGADKHRFSPREKSPKGNSILILLQGKSKFVFIGHKIFEFELEAGDKPVEFISYVGPNDVPYPYLVGEKNTYFMLDEVSVPNEAIDVKKDAYAQFYGATDLPTRKFRVRTIEKRIMS